MDLNHRLPGLEPEVETLSYWPVWLCSASNMPVWAGIRQLRDSDRTQVNLLRRSRPDAPCATVYEGHFDTPKTKRRARTIPLGPKALSILSVLHKRARDPNDLVFSTRSGEALCRRNLLHRHLQPTCKKLGLPRMSWHALRH